MVYNTLLLLDRHFPELFLKLFGLPFTVLHQTHGTSASILTSLFPSPLIEVPMMIDQSFR